jgi:hypothetical protein
MSETAANLACNAIHLGRLMRGARIQAGYEDVRMMAAELRRRGVHVTAAGLTKIEAGEAIPTFPIVTAVAVITEPPGGIWWFCAGLDVWLQKGLHDLRRMEP